MIYLGSAKMDSENISDGNGRFSSQINGWGKLYDDFIDAGILKEKIENFGRISKESKRTVFSVALALHDASVASGECRKDIAVIAVNQDCCQNANLAYFQDYAAHGRTIGRGNLFVGTLPTAPGAMAGIACGLHGPQYFCAFNADEQIGPALKETKMLLESGEASEAVLILSDVEAVAAFVFGSGKDNLNYSELDKGNGVAAFWKFVIAAQRL
ncbi:MAG: hypothetical protein WC082_12155 [Victivallales bacterium]|jgi:hypothetical protein